MGDFPAQNPYGEQPPPGRQPQQGPPSQGPPPGPGTAEPYPGYDDVHADYYRSQQEAAGPPASANPMRSMDGWGMPPARPGLNPNEQATYDSAKNVIRGKVLRLVGILGMLLLIGIFSLEVYSKA